MSGGGGVDHKGNTANLMCALGRKWARSCVSTKGAGLPFGV